MGFQTVTKHNLKTNKIKIKKQKDFSLECYGKGTGSAKVPPGKAVSGQASISHFVMSGEAYTEA